MISFDGTKILGTRAMAVMVIALCAVWMPQQVAFADDGGSQPTPVAETQTQVEMESVEAVEPEQPGGDENTATAEVDISQDEQDATESVPVDENKTPHELPEQLNNVEGDPVDEQGATIEDSTETDEAQDGKSLHAEAGTENSEEEKSEFSNEEIDESNNGSGDDVVETQDGNLLDTDANTENSEEDFPHFSDNANVESSGASELAAAELEEQQNLDETEASQMESMDGSTEEQVDPIEGDDSNKTEETVEDDAVVETVVPDPYFFVAGVKHSYLPEQGNCEGLENCHVSSTPIQDALNAVAGGLTPDDGTLYIEGAIYTEDIQISNLSDLTLLGAANGQETTLAGNVSIVESQSITLQDFTILKTILLEDATNITINGTNQDDKISVTLTGDSQVEVEAEAGDDEITVHGSHGEANVSGGADDDVLVIDFILDDEPADAQINFDGGDGFDKLETKGGKFDVIAYSPINEHSGAIFYDGVSVRYANIEPIQDLSPATKASFLGTSSNDVIDIEDGDIVIEATNCPGGCQTIEIKSANFEDIKIANKENVILDGGKGDDTITVDFSSKAQGLKTLVVYGGQQDQNKLIMEEMPSSGVTILFAVADKVVIEGTSSGDTVNIVDGENFIGAGYCASGCQTIKVTSDKFENVSFTKVTAATLESRDGNDVINISLSSAAKDLKVLAIDPGKGDDKITVSKCITPGVSLLIDAKILAIS